MRGWHEFVAIIDDVVPMPVLALILLAVTTLVAVLWYFWPDWLPRWRGSRSGKRRGRFRWRWPRLRWPRWRQWRWARWRWRWRRRRTTSDDHADLPADELPEIPAAVLTLSADELAAQGRYREAVRERLRAIVRDLVEREVIGHRPGWTVTELAGMAGRARPETATPLAAASHIFSGIWYAQRPALAEHDAAMRQHAEQVRAALDGQAVRGR